MKLEDMTEHDFEPVHGLPAPLPQGERILWQGAPHWRSLAIRAFHVRKVAIYFALFGLWQIGATLAAGHGLLAALASVQALFLAAVLAMGLLGSLAWLYARTTAYTITDRRLVVRTGAAVSITMNIPFRLIHSAGVKRHADGSGDIPLRLMPGERTSFIMLWPSARPWHFSRPEPMLRAVPEAEQVAAILGQALKNANPGTSVPNPVRPPGRQPVAERPASTTAAAA